MMPPSDEEMTPLLDDLPEPEDAVPVPEATGQPMEFGPMDERWKSDFHGLLHLGYLTASFEWLGHKFVIKTLDSEEELIIGLLIKEWDGTIAATKAYAIAVCAMCVQFIDSQPMPEPIGQDKLKYRSAHQRFNYAKQWFNPTITVIFSNYLKLENRVKVVLEEMGKDWKPEDGSNENSGTPSAEEFFGGLPFR